MRDEAAREVRWREDFPYDPIPPLLASGHPALVYFVARDLIGCEPAHALETLWELPHPGAMLRRQQAEGSWPYPGKAATKWSTTNYSQLESYRQLAVLVDMYGFSRQHPAVELAAEYFFRHQTEEGDIRGIYGRQYAPNYTAAIAELLIRAGFGQDARIGRVFAWLESIRQTDGGWAIPFRTVGRNLDAIDDGATIAPDLTRPSSHLVTGIVLRAYAAHPDHRLSTSAREAGEFLASRLFTRDVYPDRNRPEDWMGFSYPFWQTDLLSALDALSWLGFAHDDHRIRAAITWFRECQRPDGLFALRVLRNRGHDSQLWLGLAVCRVWKRFFDTMLVRTADR